MSQKTKSDWALVRAAFEAGASARGLGRQWGVSDAAVRKHAKAEGWGAAAAPEPGQKTKDPLGYMLAVMNDPAASARRRDHMAIAAAPYVHRRVHETGKKEEAADRAVAAATGRYATPPAPRLVVNYGSKNPAPE